MIENVDVLNEFYKKIESVSSIGNLKSVCNELCQYIELDYYAIYTRTSRAEGSPLHYCGNLPKRGFGNNTKHENPIVDYSKKDFFPVVWSNSLSPQDRPHIFPFGVGINTRDSGFLSFGGGAKGEDYLEKNSFLITALPILANITTQKLFDLLREKEKKKLSVREFDCLALSARGLRAEEISETMFLAKRTVYFHLNNVKKRLGIKCIVEAYPMINFISEKNCIVDDENFIEVF